MSEIKIIDNSEEILELLKQKAQTALEVCGQTAEGYAVTNCPVDTGNLRNSITHKIDGDECYIGTPVEYGVYIEYGTGVSAAGGRKTPWVYKDSKGDWHMTNGQRARPFIKPAIADHVNEYKNIIEDILKS